MADNPTRTEIFVAGGGPAGLAAAIAARQLGFEVTLADCARPPIDKACGEGIMPDGLAALRELGIFLGPGQSAPFRGIRFLDERSQVEAVFPHGVGYGIRRTVLHAMMVERARQLGIAMHWGTYIKRPSANAVSIAGRELRFQWMICADGQNSQLRRAAGMDRSRCTGKRYGYRRHYKVVPWTDHVEVHWADCGQMYVTPVGADEVCIAFITRHAQLRFDEALPQFAALASRLKDLPPRKDFLGALTTTRTFASVQSHNVALVGEASGSVDAITGEGLALAFRQAFALAAALRAGDLRDYEMAHRRIARVPRLMSSLMLTLDRHTGLRRRTLRAMAADSSAFAHMLAIHTGAVPMRDFDIRHGLSLGWNLLAA